jgi:transglutaminase-like putative cysteine protease
MRLFVRHETRYDYDTALAYSVQRLYLTPLDFASQKVVSWKISAPGIDAALAYFDGFGNRVHVVTFHDLSGPATISAEGIVDCTDAAGVVRGLSCPAPDAVFLRQTKSTMPSAAIRAVAERAAASSPATLDRLHHLMSDIRTKVAYEIGATHALTTAAEAFAAGRGVCQDHAHIFIGAARSLGIPCRYVTGYLVTADGASAAAAHAWAEALVTDLGWAGFDPANGTSPTDHYVRVAGGIDAAGVTPIRGSRRGGESERMMVEVRVEIAQQ